VKAFFAIVLGVIGLLMSTCGLAFIGNAPPIAVPSILVGALLIWAAVALFQSWRSKMTPTDAPKADDAAPPQ
jgi:uncharacterized membrane protein (DUF441 family)